MLRKKLKRYFFDPVKETRRHLRRFLSHPKLAIAYYRFQSHISKRDWNAAKRSVQTLTEMAIACRDSLVMKAMAEAAGRLGMYEMAAATGMTCARLLGKVSSSDWAGEDLTNATLVVHFMESEKQGLALGLNMTGYVEEARRRAKHCILVVERRLAPIFQRTLPDVEVRSFPIQPISRAGTQFVTANVLSLRFLLGCSVDSIRKRFRPLQCDNVTALELRRKYIASGSLPVIGISWWSSHHGKDLPNVEHWIRLMESFPAVYVCMQYNPPLSDLKAFERLTVSKFIVDESVDQLKDMDRFASQVGAIDLLITISNTGAHLAGGMGVKTILIRDDWFRRGWPVLSDKTPWYPNTQVFGRDGTYWNSVFDRIIETLESALEIRVSL